MNKQTLDEIVQPYCQKRQHLTLVMGLYQDGKSSVFGYGPDMKGASSAPNGNTIFEIGSITKVFTSTLLAKLVEQGDLDLSQPINQLGPPYTSLPDHITCESLSTHTSGLPRIPKNLTQAIKANPQNPYAAYTFEQLDDYLRHYKDRSRSPSYPIGYSNLGVGLLGNILASQLHQSYEQAVLSQICQPLQLFDTCVTLNSAQQQNLREGRSPKGQVVKNWDIPTLAGAGALRSNANDMLKFLAAHLNPPNTPLGNAIRATHPLRRDFPSPPAFFKRLDKLGVFKLLRKVFGEPPVHFIPKGIGLGWMIADLPATQQSILWHNGGTGGYRTFCGFNPKNQTAVVVLSNYAEGPLSTFRHETLDNIGLQILSLLALNSHMLVECDGGIQKKHKL